jgi:hypothetical protein
VSERSGIFDAHRCATALRATRKCFAKKMPLFKCSAKTHRAHAMHSTHSVRASTVPMPAVRAGRRGSAPEKNFRGIVDMPKNRD